MRNEYGITTPAGANLQQLQTPTESEEEILWIGAIDKSDSSDTSAQHRYSESANKVSDRFIESQVEVKDTKSSGVGFLIGAVVVFVTAWIIEATFFDSHMFSPFFSYPRSWGIMGKIVGNVLFWGGWAVTIWLGKTGIALLIGSRKLGVPVSEVAIDGYSGLLPFDFDGKRWQASVQFNQKFNVAELRSKWKLWNTAEVIPQVFSNCMYTHSNDTQKAIIAAEAAIVTETLGISDFVDSVKISMVPE
jgi:hypothetical protein